MIVSFDQSFLKALRKINDHKLKANILQVITELEDAKSISQLPNVKKLQGFKTFYRIRLGNYRLGFELISNNEIRIITFAHRKGIYNIFP